MKRNRDGITLIALIITIIILVILAGVSLSYVLGDNGVVTNAMRIELETSKGEIRDHLLLNLNDELLSCSADIYGTATDISTRYNELKLINFLAGNMNYKDTDHEDSSAVECIEPLEDAVAITPKKQDADISDDVKSALVSKGLITSDKKIYNKYRIIPSALSAEVDNYGKGKTDKDIFVLEAVNEDGTKITGEDGNNTSSGKYQLIYYDKDKKATVLETISLYMTNQS